MKSRHTSPHLTSLTIPLLKPLRDLKVTIWPSSGGQLAAVPACFAVGLIYYHLNAITSIAFLSFGFAADDLRSLCRRSRPRATRQDAIHGLLHHRKKAMGPCLRRRR